MTDETSPVTSSGRVDARPSPADAVVGRRRWPLFVALGAAVVVADQVSKAFVTGSLAPGQSVDVLGETVRIVFGQNSGALFGLFKDNAAMFGLVSIVVVGLIVVYHARAAGTLYLTVTLGLLLGGAIGNMLDRLRLGFVVDFVDVGIGTLRFYTFNVADAAISLAILLLFIAAIRPALVDGPARGRAADPTGASAVASDDDWPDDDRVDDEPVDDEPGADKPVDDEPGADKPGADEAPPR